MMNKDFINTDWRAAIGRNILLSIRNRVIFIIYNIASDERIDFYRYISNNLEGKRAETLANILIE